MTRDEALVMTGEELRIRAWELHTGNVYVPSEPSAVDSLADIPDFPNDIAAAWELVDAKGNLTLDVGGDDVRATFDWASVDADADIVELRRGNEPWLVTTARAITRAFILAMEEAPRVEEE